MALTTSTITGRVPLPTDEVLQYAELTFALSGLDTQGADVLPGGIIKRVTLVNSELPAGFKLWRNTSGLRGTHYCVLARWSVKDRDGVREQYADLGIIQVGASVSYTLASLLNTSVPQAVGTFWSAISQAEYDAAIQAVIDAQAWDESPTAPGAPGTKSAKTWAVDAEASAALIGSAMLAFETWAVASPLTIPIATKYIKVGGIIYRRTVGGNTEFTTAGGVTWAPDYDSASNKPPILLINTGQSNALGGSGVTGGERATINGNVYLWEQFPGAGQTTGWKRAGPTSSDWPFLTTGNFFAYHFADILQRQTGRTVLIVSQAVGGTPLAEFMPSGGGVSGATGTIWSALNNIITAVQTVAVPGRNDGKTLANLGVTAGDVFLWHQGEADADYRFPSDTRAASHVQYVQRFGSMIAAMKGPTYKFLRPSAPVLIGELLIGGTSGGSPTDDRNLALRQIAASDEYTMFIPSDGLKSTDNLHFDGSELHELGRRYFAGMSGLPKQVPSYTSADLTVLPGGRLVAMRGNAITVNAGATVLVTLPVTMASNAYVPSIMLSAHGSSSPYMPKVLNRTATTFEINNPGPQNMVVSWSILDLKAVP